MDENRELLTVGEAAEALGISKRAVYKRITQGKWQGELIIQDGIKMIPRKVIAAEKGIEPSEPDSGMNLDCTEPNLVLANLLEALNQMNERLKEIEQRLTNIEARLPNDTIENEPIELHEPEKVSWFKKVFGGSK